MYFAPYFPVGMSRSYFTLFLGVVCGTALQLQQSALWPQYVYVLLVLCAAGVAWWQRVRMQGAMALLLAALLAWGGTGWRATAYVAEALDPALDGQDVTVVGVVADMPHLYPGAVRFRLQVESAQHNGRSVPVPPLWDIGWYSGFAGVATKDSLQRKPAELLAGQRWRMTVRVKAPYGAMNPHGFDTELWLWEQGVQALGTVRAGAKDVAPERLATTGKFLLSRFRQSVRDRILQHIPDPQQAGLVAALVVGDQSAIAKTDWDVFRVTGVAHLVSISGLHVTMFAWMAVHVVGWWWRRSERLCQRIPAPHAALVGGILLATVYALFAGWGVPAQRTCLMLAAVALLRLWGLRWPWPQVWLLAAAVVVVLDPWALLKSGFWLSFVAVGVLFASDTAMQTQPLPWWQRLRNMVREQAVITLALAPLTLFLFGQVSVVGLLANVVAVPWVTLLLTPLAMAGVLLTPFWTLAAMASGGLMAVLEWFATFRWAVFAVAMPPMWVVVWAMPAALLMVLSLPWRVRMLGLPPLLVLFLWQPPAPSARHFEILAPDVGQGNAVIVKTQHHALLYDAGPRWSQDNDAGQRVLVPLLQALDITLNRVVISHGDADHIGGAESVLRTQPRADLLSSIDAAHPLAQFSRFERCAAGQRWVWDGVTFEILYPDPADYDKALSTNARSCVLRVSNGVQAALLVGDIGQAQELALVASQLPLRSDVLLVPHHGSKTSSSPAFLAAVAPRWALVQSGHRNRYGHPAPSVMERYHDAGIAVRNSPQCGAWRWKSVQAHLSECERTQRMRYWHRQTGLNLATVK
jgi:competence protein ComEC